MLELNLHTTGKLLFDKSNIQMHKVNTTLNMQEDIKDQLVAGHSFTKLRMKIFKGLLYHTLKLYF
jgi:hypothetical protein